MMTTANDKSWDTKIKLCKRVEIKICAAATSTKQIAVASDILPGHWSAGVVWSLTKRLSIPSCQENQYSNKVKLGISNIIEMKIRGSGLNNESVLTLSLRISKKPQAIKQKAVLNFIEGSMGCIC